MSEVLPPGLPHYLSPNAKIGITCFFVLYVVWIFRKAVREKLDLVDAFMLAAVAIVPYIFMLWPAGVLLLCRLLGVQFPFILLFAALHVCCFLLLYSAVARINRLNEKLSAALQELALQHPYEADTKTESTSARANASRR